MKPLNKWQTLINWGKVKRATSNSADRTNKVDRSHDEKPYDELLKNYKDFIKNLENADLRH